MDKSLKVVTMSKSSTWIRSLVSLPLMSNPTVSAVRVKKKLWSKCGTSYSHMTLTDLPLGVKCWEVKTIMPSGPSRFYLLFFEAEERLDCPFWTENAALSDSSSQTGRFFQHFWGREANLYTEFKKAWISTQLTGSGWNNSVTLTYSLSCF